MASCFQSFLILVLVSLFAVSFSKLFEYEYTNSRFNSLSNESPTIQLMFGSPCTNRTGNVKKFNSDVWIINNTLIECSNNRSRNPVFRLKTKSINATERDPVVFVTRDDNNVQSWKLPLQLQTFSTSFDTSYRTICSTVFRDNNTNEQEVAMYVDVFTSSSEELEYDIEIEPVENFILTLHNETVDGSVSFYAAANVPQIHYFKFPEGYSTVHVVATSPNKSGCAIVSVQNATCPVNDLLENARSKGVYQTMITDASLTVTANETIEGDDFFIVVIVAKGSLCHKLKLVELIPSNPSGDFTDFYDPYYVTLTVKSWKPASQYPVAIIAPVILFIVLGIVVCAIFICPCCHCGFRPCHCCKKNNEEDEFRPLIGTKPKVGYKTLKESGNRDEVASEGTINQNEGTMKILNQLQTPNSELHKRYSVYGWNTITVGIFYGLPAFQLVLAEQQILNTSGNQDACYYNFKCSHPLGVLSSFNSIWSNIGFMILGLTFIVIVGFRHYKSIKEKNHNPEKYNNYGIPQFFGIYYAMGFGSIMEGFMSSFYHICPSGNNFQFDTAFMFIIGGLLIIKIFQNRHCDIHSDAFIAFFCFGVVIFLTLIGIYEDSKAYWATRATLLALVVISIFTFCVSFYFYHDWRTGQWIECDMCNRIYNWLKTCCTCKLRHKARFVKMTITLIINIVVVFCMVFLRNDVPSIVLSLFITNFLLIIIMYVISKFYFKEPWTAMPFVFLVIIGICWPAAFYFYFNNVAQWNASPAESRQYNKECKIFDFYDNHDIWHFISALGLFFSFLLMLTLDDGLKDTRRENIKVF